MRLRSALEFIGILSAIGTMTGYLAAQFQPDEFRTATAVSFNVGIATDRCGYAAQQALSDAVLKPIVMQSAYYRTELDYTPADEIVQRIQTNASIRCLTLGGHDSFRVEYQAADRYESLEIVRILTEQMTKAAGQLTHVVEPVQTAPAGPGPAGYMLVGLASGLFLGIWTASLAHYTHRRRRN